MDKEKIVGGTGITAGRNVSIDNSGQVAIGSYINQFKIEKSSGEELVKLMDYLDKQRQETFRELPSIIVFSSEKHVKYIPPIIDSISGTLEKKGFKVKLLSDETRDFSRYVDEFVKIADECVYGVILLDGFRPNVLFEFGILLGLKKPISVLMSDEAFIAVTTLYENNKDAGLSPTEFGKMKNPKIRLGTSNHFSDLSTHISRFNASTYMVKEEHVSKKLEASVASFIKSRIKSG